MQFNSWAYLIFLIFVLIIYYFLDRKNQNIFLLIASYFFYSAWDWRFSGLILISTLVDYVCGKKIHASGDLRIRRRFLVLSVVVNLGLLAVFKYFNFFLDNFYLLINSLGFNPDRVSLRILLPVGISFYTFQTLSYSIDIYRKKIEPSENFLDFALFVAFFPQLVAGPIERAKNMLPQISARRSFKLDDFEKGIWLIYWGLFKKIFIADNLAFLVNENFANSAQISFPVAYLSLVAFAFQIYCDFSAYTDIARGSARLFGFRLMNNFNFPYLAENPQDFWRRWHISLSTWLRDYLYISLGGNRKGRFLTYRNLFITMVLGGLWHGAAWNFVLWGAYHGFILMIYRFISELREIRLGRWISVFIMYQFTLLGWLLFRCTRTELVNGLWVDRSFYQIMEFLGSIFRGFYLDPQFWTLFKDILFFIAPLIFLETLQYLSKDKYIIIRVPSYISIPINAMIIFFLVRYGVQGGDAFIYFQF